MKKSSFLLNFTRHFLVFSMRFLTISFSFIWVTNLLFAADARYVTSGDTTYTFRPSYSKPSETVSYHPNYPDMPKTDSLGDSPPSYMFICASFPTCFTSPPKYYGRPDIVAKKHIHRKNLLRFETVRDECYRKFRKIVVRNSATEVMTPRRTALSLARIAGGNSRASNYSLTVPYYSLTSEVFYDWLAIRTPKPEEWLLVDYNGEVEKRLFSFGPTPNRPPLDAVFILWSEDLQYYEDFGIKTSNTPKPEYLKSVRLDMLKRLKEKNINVYIFNKFFKIPDYIRNHELVTILEDRDPLHDSAADPFNPPIQTWTNLDGKSIEAGYLDCYYPRNYVAVWKNERVYHIPWKNLSQESKDLANNLKRNGLNHYKTLEMVYSRGTNPRHR